MNKIYLLSGPLKHGGFSSKIKPYLKEDLKNIKNCVLISTNPTDFIKNDEYKKRIIRDLKEVSNIENYTLLDNRIVDKEGQKILNSAELIYLLGGNPVSQLKYIKDNCYDKIIKKSNAIIIGTSAGAMNLNKIAYYSKDEDINQSFFYNGLNLIDITIDPHFDIKNNIQKTEALKNSYKHQIYGLSDNAGIIIYKEQFTYVGDIYMIKKGEITHCNEE